MYSSVKNYTYVFVSSIIEGKDNSFIQSKMFSMGIDKKMLPMKLHYFLYLGSKYNVIYFNYNL